MRLETGPAVPLTANDYRQESQNISRKQPIDLLPTSGIFIGSGGRMPLELPRSSDDERGFLLRSLSICFQSNRLQQFPLLVIEFNRVVVSP